MNNFHKRLVLPAVLLAMLVGAVRANLTAPALAVVRNLSPAQRRLPQNVRPDSYELDLQPDLQNATFQGTETISLHVDGNQADVIDLNSQDLEITAVQISTASGASLKEHHQLIPSESLLEIRSDASFPAGTYRLHISFKGKLNDKLVGFYRSTFQDKEGHAHVLAVTQFEPADARRMFPCFDEPACKATYRLSVRTRRGLSAVTNAALEKTDENSDGTVTYRFGTTPPMSSYLVALVVGELEATPPVVVDGVPIRVWSVAGKNELGLYSRDEAAKFLTYLTKYFGIAYPWKKLDLIAIPDFEAGAMENPGAITFRETLLLIDPNTASSHAKRSASSVIAHEMAHLWFGDLVTMQWWDDLWLNEAFATWMSTRAVNAVHPDWDHWKEYAESRSGAMHTDGLKSTRAIHAPVTNPEQAHEMFDVITYEKGSAILRMLERFVSEDVFEKGVHNYLQKHSFANATTNDLWDAIGDAAKSPVRQIMDGWVNRAGYPLLTLSAQPQSGYSASQQRFFEKAGEPVDPTIWQVPIGLRSLAGAVNEHVQSLPQQTELLAARSGAASCVACTSGAPVFANAGGVGYYRSKYPAAAYVELIKRVEDSADPAERLALLDDTWALVRSGDLGIDTYFSLLAALRPDKDEMVWDEIISQLESLDRYVEPANRPAFEKFVREQLSRLEAFLGWKAAKGESPQMHILRARMLSALGTFGHDADTITTARKLFEQVKGSSGAAGIDPDLMQPVTTIVAYNGGPSEFQYFNNKWQHAATPEQYIRNLMALGEFHQPDLVQKVMEMSVSGKVKTQDAPGLLGELLSRRDTNERAWQFIETNWQKINNLYPEEMVPHLVSRASSFTTQPQYEKVKAFVTTHRIRSGESAVSRMLEHVEINVRFRNSAAAHLNEWINKHYGNV